MAKAKCRDCQATIKKLQRSGYCKTCLLQHCEHCGERMDKERKGRLCLPCMRKKRALAAERSRPCYSCKEPMPAGRVSDLCTACARATYELRRALLLRQGARACASCGEPMPPGRDNRLCTDCYQQKRQAGWQQRPCALCGTRKRSKGASYCKPCHALYQNWSRDYRRGSTEARLVKPKAKRIRWQETQP